MTITFEEIRQECLRDPETAAAYLSLALEDGSESRIQKSLENIAKAQEGGIDGLGKRLKIKPESARKMLSTAANSDLATFVKIATALGLELRVEVQPEVDSYREEGGRARASA